jgi:hypothetical protein
MSNVVNATDTANGANAPETPAVTEATGVSLPAIRVQVDQDQIHRHLDGVVRDTVEATLNALLDAEADELCGAPRYQRSPDRIDTRAGGQVPPEVSDGDGLLARALNSHRVFC